MSDLSDDTSSGSSCHSPPLERERSKKVKKSRKLHKTRAVKVKRKHLKRKHVSSSSSSSASLSGMEPDLSGPLKKSSAVKKSRLEHKKSRSRSKCAESQLESSQQSHLLNVFQRHYKSLVAMIKSCPVVVSSTLFSGGFISEETLNRVITGQDSHVKKASLLLCDVRAHLKHNPEALIEFIRLLEEDKSFEFLANQMKGKHYLSCGNLHP